MTSELIHPATKSAVASVLAAKTASIAVIGPAGSGAEALAYEMAASALQLTTESLLQYPYFLAVKPDGKEVSIEQVRQVQRFVSLKTTGTADIRRVVLIERADTMNTQAQNALLKTIEEPPVDTVIIVIGQEADHFLPTIRSRVQVVSVQPVSLEQASKHFKLGFDEDKIQKAHAISGGRVELLKSLLEEAENAEVLGSIDEAKRLLTMGVYERLAEVDALSKDREAANQLLDGFKVICSGALQQSARKSGTAQVAAWHHRLQLVLDAQEAAARNANTKLLLTDLFLSL